MKRTSVSILLCGILAVAVSACSKNDTPASETHEVSPVDLYRSDYAALSKLDDQPFADYDRANNGLASQIFGTADGAGVRAYLKERTSYFVKKSEIKVYPEGLFNSSGDDYSTLLPGFDEREVVTVASNIGAGLWLVGQVIGQPVSFSVDGGAQIPVNSTRAGLVIFGKGYNDKKDNSINGELYRQAVIVHEARHSDCTGGITSDDVQNMRQALSQRPRPNLAAYIKATKRCGHSHAICPFGHNFAGYAACDDESFGAYTIGGIFAEAATYGIRDNVKKSIGDSIAIDSRSRVLVPRTGTPDMTSGGLTTAPTVVVPGPLAGAGN